MNEAADSIVTITHRHGRTMYILGLEHAISMMEVMGEDALPHLKNSLEKERKELEDEQDKPASN